MTGQDDRDHEHRSRGDGDTDAEPLCLSTTQLRVLGALIEKEATVPDTYPMTLNALVTACNQKNNRDPVVAYDATLVERTLSECKAAGLVRFVHASHGARSTKYRHVVADRLGLDDAELQLLAVLALRGPNTVNELRVRTERSHGFADNDQVERTMEALASRTPPLVVHLPRQTGQKETRWMHLLGGEIDDTVQASEIDDTVQASEIDHTGPGDDETVAPVAHGAAMSVASTARTDGADRIDALERRVAALEGTLESVLGELGMTGSTIDPATTDDSEV